MMANPLYNELSKNRPVTQQDAMRELKAHPGDVLKRAGFNVPDNLIGNPQATVMHLIQSGQVGGPMMQRIQPLLSRMMGRR